jgi:hypothetical protein
MMNVNLEAGGRCGSASPPSVMSASTRLGRGHDIPILYSRESPLLAERVGGSDVLLFYRRSVVDWLSALAQNTRYGSSLQSPSLDKLWRETVSLDVL